MYTLAELREQRAAVLDVIEAGAAHIEAARSADYDGDLITADDVEALDAYLAADADLRSQIEAVEAREARIQSAVDATVSTSDGFHFNRNAAGSSDTEARVADGSAAPAEARSFLLERAEQGVKAGFVSADHAAGVESLLGRGQSRNFNAGQFAAYSALTETEAFRSAFMKKVHSQPMTDREAQIVARAQSIGTDSEGGFGVPVLIDPTILVTTGTGHLDLLDAANVKAITTDEWKGVSAPVAAWSGDAEAAEVSDDAVTFAQPTVTTEKPQTYIPYSIEVGMDYPGFASEMGKVIADGYMDYLAEELAVGTAGVVGVEVGATTTVDVATDNTFAVGDVRAVYADLPEKFRRNASWFYNVGVENSIRGFATSDGGNFTVDLTAGGIGTLLGKRTILSDYASGPSATTSLTDGATILVIGDMEHFVVAQRLGMTIEIDPIVIGSNRRPTGQRGMYAYARVGSGVVVANAFRKLKNITT